jgi:hypothetical protein
MVRSWRASASLRERFLPCLPDEGIHVFRWLIVLDKSHDLPVARHARLFKPNLRRFVGSEKNVVMRGILAIGKLLGCQIAAKMIAAPRRNVNGAPNLLILNVTPGERKHLSSKPQLAELTRNGIVRELRVMGCDSFGVPLGQFGLLYSAAGDTHEADRTVLVFHRKRAVGAGRDKIDLARRQIGDVGVVSETKPVALLCFLRAEIEMKSMERAIVIEIDFDPIGSGHAQAQFFRLGADLSVINRQAAAENGLVYTVQSSPAKTVFLGVGGQRSRRGVGRDTENDVVGRINVPFETDLFAFRRDSEIGEVEVAAAGDFIGEDVTSGETKFLHRPTLKSLIKMSDRISLDREIGILQKLEVDDVAGIFKIDEDADFLAWFGFKGGFQQPREAERRKSTGGDLLGNGHSIHSLICYVIGGNADAVS